MPNYNFLDDDILPLAQSQLYTTPQTTPSPHITTPSPPSPTIRHISPSPPSHTVQQSSPSQSSPTAQDITTSQTTLISHINSPSPTPTSKTQTSPTSPPQHIITLVSPHAPPNMVFLNLVNFSTYTYQPLNPFLLYPQTQLMH